MTRAAALLVTLALLAGTAGHAAAQPGSGRTPSEYEVKAAYLLNFLRFARWMRPDTGALSVCILGSDPFGPTLDATIAADRPGGRAVMVRRLSPTDDPRSCHILYISASEEPRLGRILAGLQGADVLTVSDVPGFVQRNGMIQLVTAGGRIRFDIHLGATEAAGVMLSSDLLRVARTVRRSGAP
jgi:hypothetical protein